jgi:hypothetical protein
MAPRKTLRITCGKCLISFKAPRFLSMVSPTGSEGSQTAAQVRRFGTHRLMNS